LCLFFDKVIFKTGDNLDTKSTKVKTQNKILKNESS